jgi:enoyl-CoA hydratase/carnithine racemase
MARTIGVGQNARMAGTLTFHTAADDGVARVVLANPGKLNAIDIAMWRELRALFDTLQRLPIAGAPRAIVVSGAEGQFASGGDIVEFASFRFDEARLHDFHEHIVAPALQAMLDCDIPLFAQIDGACIGGGLEIAACCDIRVCGAGSRFGAPIAKLGFPMAPGELALLVQVAGAATLREMLLEARLFDAARALQLGLVHAVVADDAVAAQTLQRARHAALLSPQAARINKRTLRQIGAGGPSDAERRAHFGYADSAEHREGVSAFIEKRPARFQA